MCKYVKESEPLATVLGKGRNITALEWWVPRKHAYTSYKTPTILGTSSRKIRQYPGGKMAESLRELWWGPEFRCQHLQNKPDILCTPDPQAPRKAETRASAGLVWMSQGKMSPRFRVNSWKVIKDGTWYWFFSSLHEHADACPHTCRYTYTAYKNKSLKNKNA